MAQAAAMARAAGYGTGGAMALGGHVLPHVILTAQVLGAGQSTGTGLGQPAPWALPGMQQDLTGAYLGAGAGAASAAWAQDPARDSQPVRQHAADPGDAPGLRPDPQASGTARTWRPARFWWKPKSTRSISPGATPPACSRPCQTKDQTPLPSWSPGPGRPGGRRLHGPYPDSRVAGRQQAADSWPCSRRTKQNHADQAGFRPSLIVTDSIPATMNVGSEVPLVAKR